MKENTYFKKMSQIRKKALKAAEAPGKFIIDSTKEGLAQVKDSLEQEDKMMGAKPKATVGQAIGNPVLTGIAFGAGASRKTRKGIKKVIEGIKKGDLPLNKKGTIGLEPMMSADKKKTWTEVKLGKLGSIKINKK